MTQSEKEDRNPYTLCYDCAYKLGWNGEKYCCSQPQLRSEYLCDCCEKTLIREKNPYTWQSTFAMMLTHLTYEDVQKVKADIKL